MSARLVFKNDKNEFVTKDVDVDPSLKGTEGGYSVQDGKRPMSLFDFDIVGVQWLRGKPKGATMRIPGRPDMFIPDDAQKITAQTMYAGGTPIEMVVTVYIDPGNEPDIDIISAKVFRAVREARHKYAVK